MCRDEEESKEDGNNNDDDKNRRKSVSQNESFVPKCSLGLEELA